MTCLPLTFFSLKGTGIPDRKKKLKKRSKQLRSYYFHFVLVCTRVYPLGRRHGVIKYRRAQWDISGLSFSRGVPPIWSPAGKTQTTRTHTAIGVADCAPVPPKWREASCWPCVCLRRNMCRYMWSTCCWAPRVPRHLNICSPMRRRGSIPRRFRPTHYRASPSPLT